MSRLQEILRAVPERRCSNHQAHTEDKPGWGERKCWCGSPMESVSEHERINVALALQANEKPTAVQMTNERIMASIRPLIET